MLTRLDGLMQSTRHKRGGIAAMVVACLLLCAGGLFPETLLPALRYERSGVAAGEWWRLLTPAFLHGSLAHLALNMLSLDNLVRTKEAHLCEFIPII